MLKFEQAQLSMQKVKFEKKIVESKKNQAPAKLAEVKGSEPRHTKLPKLNSYASNMNCALRYDQSGICQYLQGIRFRRLLTGQNRLVFHKNNIWDHPTCFLHGCLRTFISFKALSS